MLRLMYCNFKLRDRTLHWKRSDYLNTSTKLNSSVWKNERTNQSIAIYYYGLTHRVGRLLSLFSSRRNWDSPNPSPTGECVLPPLDPGGGAHTLVREGVGESHFRRGDIHTLWYWEEGGTLVGERGGGGVPIPTRGHTLWHSLSTCTRTLWSNLSISIQQCVFSNWWR